MIIVQLLVLVYKICKYVDLIWAVIIHLGSFYTMSRTETEAQLIKQSTAFRVKYRLEQG